MAAEPTVRAVCPGCGLAGKAPARLAGKSVRCSRCGASFAVDLAPAATEREAPAPTEAARGPGPQVADWNVGDVVLGLYDVRAVLGQGGMGRVYRVHHRAWDVDLAVKAPLPKALEAAGGVAAFEQEAETWVNLGLHPHVVSCYYVRRVEGVPRVFAEYVDGGSLHEAIYERRFPRMPEALDVAIQFAWGLHYAHEQGLVHQDVKPANVMLTRDGTAKVTDFGLARARTGAGPLAAAGGHTVTVAGGGGGTPAYMSPEQWEGRPLTRRSDAWSWGLSVLELLRGDRTWEMGPAAAQVLQEWLGEGAELPDAVRQLLVRCFDPDPERRPRTLGDAADSLITVYEALAGDAYPRPRPRAGRQTADSLNNRAVSLLDLGRPEVEALWAQALTVEPQHLESAYNQGLFAWSHGRLADEALLARVEEAGRAAGEARAAVARARLAAVRAEAVPARSLRGLGGAVGALAVTADGALVAAAAGGSEVRLWPAAQGAAARVLHAAALRVRALAFTPDGRFLLLAGEGGPPELWDVAAGRLARSFQHHPGVATALAVTPDGTHAVTGSSDRDVRVWELSTGRLERTLEGHTEAVTALAVTHDGTRAVSAGLDGTLRVWDLAGGSMTAALSGHRGHVLAVDVDGRAGLVASGGEDRTLRLWSLAQGKPLAVIGGPSAPVSAVALARGAVLAGSVDRSLRAWDQGRSALIRVERLEGPVHALHAGPQGVWAASGAAVHLVAEGGPRLPGYLLARPVSAREVETRDAAFLQRLADARRSLTQGDVGRALALAREARTVPGHERSEAALALWDDVTALLPRRGLASAWEAASLEGHRDPVLAVAVGGDGAQAVSGDLVGVVRAWDLGRRADRGVLGAHDATVAGVAVAPDGRHAVSGSWDRTVRVWDLGTRKLARTLTAHEDYVNGVAVSPDGRRVLSASSDRTLRLWDLASGRPLATLAGHEAQVSSCVFGPDGRFALSGGWDATVRAWDAQTREGVFVLEGHEDSVGAVAVSPDGRQAASGGLDRTVRVWDLRSRRCVRVFAGHAAEVTAVAFFLDGRYLASASRDKTVRVWDGATGEATRTLALTGAVLSLAPLPAANGLLTAGTDLALRLWRLEWEPEARAAPAWDEKASAHLQTLMSLRTMPGTGTRVTEADLDTIVRDLRNRGFGGLRRETVAAHVRDLAASGETLSPWEEIRRAAPRAAAREVAVKAARGARRKLPPLRVALAAAAAVASVALGLFLFRTQRTVLGYARHQVARFADDPFHVELPAAGASCVATGYEEYLAQAREPLVSTRVLGCLAHLKPPGIVEAYLATMQLADDDSALATRRRRNAVSLMAALGEPGLPSLCAALATGGADARWVAARALAAQGLPAAAECLFDRARHPDVGVRLAVVGVLPWLFGRETVEPARAWEITQVVLADGDPRVRRAALDAVAFFDWDHASDTLQRVEKDADAELAQAAAGLRKSLNTHRKLNPDRPY